MKIFNKLFPFILVSVLSFFTFLPLLNSGFFPIHDNTQVARVYEMTKALSEGVFPVRWSADLGFGYGYPIFNFYAPFAYYVGGIISLIGLDALVSTKAMMLIGILISAISMYLLSKEIFGKYAGVLSALLYAYAPYHAVDIYVRGDVSEFYAYAFIPLIFYGMYKIYKLNNFWGVVITSVSFALTILSHNLTAFMISPFILLFMIFLLYKNPKTLKNFLLSIILALLLSAFYFIPTLLEMNYTNVISQVGGGADFKDHFVCLSQLWTSQWGFGGSTKGCIDGLSFMIGKFHLILGFLSLVFAAFFVYKNKISKLEKEDKNILYIFLIFTLFFALSVLFMIDSSKIIWQILKPMEFLQYPWRFLIVTSLSTSLISGFLIYFAQKYLKTNLLLVVTAVLVLATIVLNIKFFAPQEVLQTKAADYTSDSIIQWDTSRISSEYMPKGFLKPNSKSQIADFSSIGQNVSVLSVDKKTTNVVINAIVDQKTSVILPVAYFPAWKGYVNGKEVSLEENKRGMMLNLDKGVNVINLRFMQTPIEAFSNLLSVAGLLGLLAGIIYSRRRYDQA